MDYIRNLDDEGLRSLCAKLFCSMGYGVDYGEGGILVLRDSKNIYYVKTAALPEDELIETCTIMELYGCMCFDNIEKGIIITNSMLDDKAYALCKKAEIEVMEKYGLVDEITSRAGEIGELLPSAAHRAGY
jgi:hypothetical protein